MTKRIYQGFDPQKGYPFGKDLFYECLLCGDILPSEPADDTACKCRNIMIDVGYGRISIRYHGKVKLFRQVETVNSGNQPLKS
jgi:hypothetical protein